MPIIGAQVTVGSTTAALIVSGVDMSLNARGAIVLNTGTTSVYLGGSGVTATTGYNLGSGLSLAIDLTAGDDLYGIRSATSEAVSVLKKQS